MPSRVSLKVDSVVLLQALCPGAEYQSFRSPRPNEGQPPGGKQDWQNIPSFPGLKWKLSQVGVGTGCLTSTCGHTMLQVCLKKLLAAPDTDVLVSFTVHDKVQKNVSLRTGQHVSWYVNTHVYMQSWNNRKVLLMRFPADNYYSW